MSAVADVARLTAALADRYRIERELEAGGLATVKIPAVLPEPLGRVESAFTSGHS